MIDRVALYLQDAHEIRDGIKYVQYAEEKGFEAVWQAYLLHVTLHSNMSGFKSHRTRTAGKPRPQSAPALVLQPSSFQRACGG